MAIVGFLVHTLGDHLAEVEARLAGKPGFSVHGTQEGQYVVVVAEVPSGSLEARFKALESWEGVLAVYTTYLSVEDELPASEGGA
jgi:nitrate reductase NapAB chaperone NapD